jgi:hypothetical protein
MNSDSRDDSVAWILRIGVAGCFIGHGAFGIITKSAWVPYFGVAGFSESAAWRLMPWVGTMDVIIGVLTLAWPCRALFGWAVMWAVWTALLRPLSGEPFWETLERAGNYGVPLAILVAVGLRDPWFSRLPSRWTDLSQATWSRVALTLRFTTVALLAGHAGLGLIIQKKGLAHHYSSLWSHAPESTVIGVGAFEFALAALVLVKPAPLVLVFVCLWKIASESLFLVAGSPVWEVIERFGSYAAPLALAILLAKNALRFCPPSFNRGRLNQSSPTHA